MLLLIIPWSVWPTWDFLLPPQRRKRERVWTIRDKLEIFVSHLFAKSWELSVPQLVKASSKDFYAWRAFLKLMILSKILLYVWVLTFWRGYNWWYLVWGHDQAAMPWVNLVHFHGITLCSEHRNRREIRLLIQIPCTCLYAPTGCVELRFNSSGILEFKAISSTSLWNGDPGEKGLLWMGRSPPRSTHWECFNLHRECTVHLACRCRSAAAHQPRR